MSRNYVARLNADGSVDSGFNPNANDWVDCLSVQADGKILLGGWFRTVNGVSRNYVARLNADGSVDSGFNPNANNVVNSLSVQADGKILLGGFFTTVAGVSRQHIARLNQNGDVDLGFSPLVGDWPGYVSFGFFYPNPGFVRTLSVQVDGKILVGGYFPNISSTGSGVAVTSGPFVARLNADGSVDSGFNPNANSTVWSLSVQADGRILLGGFFTTVNGVSRNYVARLNADGSVDSGFNPGADNVVNSLSVQADGKILLGGQFTTVGGVSRANFARLPNDPATQSLVVTGTGQVDWQRGGSAPEVSQVTFESWNGTTWVAVGTPVRVAGGWQATGLSLPNSGWIRARGSTSGGLYNGSSAVIQQVSPAPASRLALESPAGTSLTDGASTTDFGSVTTSGSGESRTYTLRNTGLLALTDVAVTVDGVDAADFTVSPLAATTIGVGESQTFSVTFAPSGVGPRSATLHVTSNDPATPSFDVFLVGSGVNQAPTGITLTPGTIAEGNAVGAVVGTLAAVDADAGDTFTYSLVAGTGSANNGSFMIVGSELRAGIVFNYELKSSYTIRVQATDAAGASFTRAFTVTVQNVNEAPINLAVSDTIVDEGLPVGSFVAVLTSSDLDIVDARTYALVDGVGSEGNGAFALAANPNIASQTWLVTAAVLNHSVQATYPIRVRVTDAGGLSQEITAVIEVQRQLMDPTFGTGGRVVLANGGRAVRQVLPLSDGSVLVAGTQAGSVDVGALSGQLTSYLETKSVFLTRLGSDGVVDGNFGVVEDGSPGGVPGGGYWQTIAYDSGVVPAQRSLAGMGRLSDGRIVLAGSKQTWTYSPAFGNLFTQLQQPVAWWSILDPNGGGIAGAMEMGAGIVGPAWNLEAMGVQSDDKILLAGWMEDGLVPRQLFVARVNPDGSMDRTFGFNGPDGSPSGVMQIPAASLTSVQSIVQKPDGKIMVVAVYSSTPTAILHLDATGLPDPGFGTFEHLGGLGVGIQEVPGGLIRARSAVLQPDGRLVISGTSVINGNWTVHRIHTGSDTLVVSDLEFGQDGYVDLGIRASDQFHPVALAPNGKIYVGNTYSAHNGYSSIRRLQANGQVDATFGTGGQVLVGGDLGFGLSCLGLAPGGRLVAGGTSAISEGLLVRLDVGESTTGTGAPEIVVEAAGGGALTSGAGTLDLGSARMGLDLPATTVTVRNVGSSALTGLEVEFAGVASLDYRATGLSSASLAPGASVTLTVTFDPLEPGTRAATLRLASNDADENPFLIPLTGVGLNAAPVANADSVQRPSSYRTLRIPVSALLANDTDENGDALSVVAVDGVLPAGASATLVGSWVVYTVADVSDGVGSFNYTLSDGIGGHTVQSSVQVLVTATPPPPVEETPPNAARLEVQSQGTDVEIVFTAIGIPGFRYRVQYSTSTSAPYVWQEFGPQAVYTAPTTGVLGVFQHIDRNPPDGMRLYRAIPHR